MASSQFTIYTSSDIGGPGLMTGLTGSLISILDACLVNGYAGHPAAGWTKPFATVSGSMAAYKQASGSQLTVFINDAAPSVAASSREAWAIGWEQVTSLTSSNTANTTGSVGSGFGQFPLPSQLLTTGHVVWRKSNTNDATGRYWTIAADSSVFYMWILTGDNAGLYYFGSFGDIYSLKSSPDLYKCLITGRNTENSSTGVGVDWQDGVTSISVVGTAQPGHFIARTAGGVGGSTTVTKKGDGAIGNLQSTAPNFVPYNGVLQTPNSLDNSLYLSPIWILENTNLMIRGKWRGLYQLCHPIANFSDGQVIQGSGDFAGKTFLLIKTSISQGIWTLEISPTIDTN